MDKRIKNCLKKWIKVDLKDFFWSIYGNTIRNPKRPEQLRSILFLCKGNISRSPFAEHLGRRITKNAYRGEWVFYSAGLNVSRSLPPPKEALLAARNFGVELNGHRSRCITRDMVESFDMILSMETWQFNNLKKSFPEYRNKVFLLPLFEVKNGLKLAGFAQYNIEDPYGKSLKKYYDCFQRIEECLIGLLEEMII